MIKDDDVNGLERGCPTLHLTKHEQVYFWFPPIKPYNNLRESSYLTSVAVDTAHTNDDEGNQGDSYDDDIM